MDIQKLTSVSTVVINSLLMLLKDNHVDVNSVVMQLSNNKDEAISPGVNLGELVQQTLDKLQKARAQKVAVPNIGLKVEIINPDDTAEDGIKVGDQGVIVWFDDEHKAYGIDFPKSGKTFSYALRDFKIVEFCGVPEGFVVVPREPTEDMLISGLAVIATGLARVDIDLEVHMIWKKMIEAQEQAQ